MFNEAEPQFNEEEIQRVEEEKTEKPVDISIPEKTDRRLNTKLKSSWRGIRDKQESGEITSDQADTAIAQLNQLSVDMFDKELVASSEKAEEIMGAENFFGQEAIKNAFGIDIKAEEIPEISFSVDDLERAKTLGQDLILRIDKFPDGDPISLMKLWEQYHQFHQGTKLDMKIYDKHDHFKSFFEGKMFLEDPPSAGWALVLKEGIRNPHDKTYVGCVEDVMKYLQNDVFAKETLPTEYKEAIEEFRDYYQENFNGLSNTEIKKTLKGPDWDKYAKNFSSLKIVQFLRQTPADFMYDSLICFANTGIKQIPFKFPVMTSCWSGDSQRLIYMDSGAFLVGHSMKEEEYVSFYGWSNEDNYREIGTSFARRS